MIKDKNVWLRTDLIWNVNKNRWSNIEEWKQNAKAKHIKWHLLQTMERGGFPVLKLSRKPATSKQLHYYAIKLLGWIMDHSIHMSSILMHTFCWKEKSTCIHLSQVKDFIITYVPCCKLSKPHRTVNITPTQSSRIYETWGKRPTLEGKK